MWTISALILSNYYSNYYFSILTVHEYERPIDSVQDLANVAAHDSKDIITYSKTFTLDKFIHAEPVNKVNYLIGMHMNR